jgi:SAM-dependent methyltransferase
MIIPAPTITPVEVCLTLLRRPVIVPSPTYVPHWLDVYEHGLDARDEYLKERELEAVRAFLEAHRPGWKARRLLDVGTCTGRYLLGLQGFATVSIGVDNDPECVRRSVHNLRGAHLAPAGEPPAAVVEADVLAPDLDLGDRFDLITCMMGTLSHLVSERGPFEGRGRALGQVLRRLRALLTLEPDGLLCLGVWTDTAVQCADFLGIYSPAGLAALAAWSPTEAELRRSLTTVGLTVISAEEVGGRLRVYFCRRSPQGKAPARGGAVPPATAEGQTEATGSQSTTEGDRA